MSFYMSDIFLAFLDTITQERREKRQPTLNGDPISPVFIQKWNLWQLGLDFKTFQTYCSLQHSSPFKPVYFIPFLNSFLSSWTLSWKGINRGNSTVTNTQNFLQLVTQHNMWFLYEFYDFYLPIRMFKKYSCGNRGIYRQLSFLLEP